MRHYVAICILLSCGLWGLAGCGGAGTKQQATQQNITDSAAKTNNHYTAADSTIPEGMPMADVEKILGKPDSVFKTTEGGDSVKVYLYYNPIHGPQYDSTPFVLFNKEGKVFISSKKSGAYYDNTGTGRKCMTTTTFDWVNYVVPDTNGAFAFNVHLSRHRQLYLYQHWDLFDAMLHDIEQVDSIQVFEKGNGKFVQTLIAGENDNSHYSSPLFFEDYNFDGHTDISINADDHTANTSRLYWVYKPSKKMFVTSDGLEGVSSAEFNDNGEVVSYWRSSCCDHGRSTYKYIHGKLVEIERLEEALTGDGDSLLFTKHKLIKGKLRLVESTMISDNESRLDE